MCAISDDFDYQVLKLTKEFYIDYSKDAYPEILRKETRPYTCLLIQSHYGYFICVPYRTHVGHKHSYKFKADKSSKKSSKEKQSGLDFSKIVIITNYSYLDNKDAIIDKQQYNETRLNIEYIKNDAQEYIDDYVDTLLGRKCKYDSIEFERTYKFSTLRYFHRELGIDKE